ncbi:hypothetical protein ACP4OV_013300 [Aristida adscensionis]
MACCSFHVRFSKYMEENKIEMSSELVEFKNEQESCHSLLQSYYQKSIVTTKFLYSLIADTDFLFDVHSYMGSILPPYDAYLIHLKKTRERFIKSLVSPLLEIARKNETFTMDLLQFVDVKIAGYGHKHTWPDLSNTLFFSAARDTTGGVLAQLCVHV